MRALGQFALAALVLVAGNARAQQAPAGTSSDPARADAQTEGDAEGLSQAEAAVDESAASEAEASQQTVSAPQGTDAADGASPAPQPSQPEAAPALTEASQELTAAELASLGLDMEDPGVDTDLHFSGFMDVTYSHLLNPEEAPLAVTAGGDQGSFFVGRLNLYLTKNLTEAFSMMAEVRFTYAPNGTGALDPGAPVASTETLDYSRSALTFRWGGIVIERAYGQWSPSQFFNVRAGQFLSPYGIWNVDHGTPVFIPVMRPFAVGGGFFPERQTGLELFGRVGLSSKVTARYHLTLSNGLGPASEYKDLDSNKALGSRVALEHVGAGSRFQVGGSTFWGENSSGFPQVGLTPDGSSLTIVKGADGQAEVLSLAADVLWQYRGFHMQAEWVGQRWEYAERGRTVLPTAGALGIPANAVPPDTFNWGGYALFGYRLPWWGIMPFGTLEYVRSYDSGIRTKTAFSQVGVNVRPGDAIVFKLQYMFAFFGTPGTEGKIVSAQLAWAF